MTPALALAASLLGAPASGADMTRPPAVPPMKPVSLPRRVEWTLPNGLSVALVEDRRAPLLTARLASPAGAAAVAPEDAGLAGALAELMTEGTASLTARQVAEAAERYGGELKAEAGPDALVLATSGLAEKAGDLLGLLADAARRPSFPAREVALRKANMAEELAAARAESDFLASVALHKKLYPGHPYGIAAPTDASIARLTRDRVRAAWSRLWTPRGATLVLVGDLDEARARALVSERFGAWTGPAAPSDRAVRRGEPGARRIFLADRPKASQVTLMLGLPAVREDDPAYFDLLLANQILGGSFSSRLVKDVRETKGWTYRIRSRLEHRRAASAFTVYTPVRTEVAGPALAAILGHLEAMREKGVEPAELEQAKAYLAGSLARELETQDGIADAVLRLKILRLPSGFYDSFVQRVQAVTEEGVRSAARRFLTPGAAVVAAAGDAARVRKALEPLAPGGVVPVTVDGD